MKYTDIPRLIKLAAGPLSGSGEQDIRSTLASTIEGSFGKEYARQLAAAYLRATGKHLANPEKHIDPFYGYLIGHAPNVDPAILSKLSENDRRNFGGWGVVEQNLTPDMLAQGVDILNNKGTYMPLNQTALGVTPESKNYRQAQLSEDLALYSEPKKRKR